LLTRAFIPLVGPCVNCSIQIVLFTRLTQTEVIGFRVPFPASLLGLLPLLCLSALSLLTCCLRELLRTEQMMEAAKGCSLMSLLQLCTAACTQDSLHLHPISSVEFFKMSLLGIHFLSGCWQVASSHLPHPGWGRQNHFQSPACIQAAPQALLHSNHIRKAT
jgi:hypothetical protein